MKADYQQNKFYDVEMQHLRKLLPKNILEEINITQAINFSKEIVGMYDIDYLPELIFTSANNLYSELQNNSTGYYHPLKNIIKLSNDACNRFVLLHELCHFICQVKFGIQICAHGKEFAGIYIDVCHNYFDVPKRKLYSIYKNNKITFMENI